eukprot:TRINITY_DN11924_c0_g1_i2.p1 TRINITY_DN11924_c0_g1~~TRINITY_DN11924_c0_g1_i2.p1  ORF type:complete len:209 (+),score=36.78 TRINITY_DN11924_c0_g1_i2:110-736(+)
MEEHNWFGIDVLVDEFEFGSRSDASDNLIVADGWDSESVVMDLVSKVSKVGGDKVSSASVELLVQDWDVDSFCQEQRIQKSGFVDIKVFSPVINSDHSSQCEGISEFGLLFSADLFHLSFVLLRSASWVRNISVRVVDDVCGLDLEVDQDRDSGIRIGAVMDGESQIDSLFLVDFGVKLLSIIEVIIKWVQHCEIKSEMVWEASRGSE